MCREANDLITESRQKSCADRVTQASHDPRTLWRCVKDLLHTSNSTENTERGMSQRSADFFKAKVAKVKSAVSALNGKLRLVSSIINRPPSRNSTTSLQRQSRRWLD